MNKKELIQQKIFVEKNIKSAGGFLKVLILIKKTPGRFIFRGLTNSKYQLQPTIFRDNIISKILEFGSGKDIEENEISKYLINFLMGEVRLLHTYQAEANHSGLFTPKDSFYCFNEVTQYSDSIFEFVLKNIDNWLPTELLELAGLMQHYGMPTRLLDWTLNPFIAAYFASNKYNTLNINEYINDSLCVWAIDIDKINLINDILDKSNLCNLKFKLKIIKTPFAENGNISSQKGLFTQIEQKILKNDLFSKNIIPESVNEHIFHNSLMIYKECCGNDNLSDILNIFKASPLIYKLNLPVNQTKELVKILDILDFDSASLFPGYQGVSKLVNEHLNGHY